MYVDISTQDSSSKIFLAHSHLLLDGDNDVAGLVVKALGGVVVSDVLDGIADDLLVVDGGSSGDLAEDHDHAGLAAGLAGNAGGLVVLDAGIEDSVGDLAVGRGSFGR